MTPLDSGVVTLVVDRYELGPVGTNCYVVRARRGAPEAVVVDRHRFDQGLCESAQKEGVELWLGNKVTNISIAETHVEIQRFDETSPLRARACILAGAQFVISPALNVQTIAACRRYGVPVFPGALTPTEVVTAWEAAGKPTLKVRVPPPVQKVKTPRSP